jgi:hypothetical protein
MNACNEPPLEREILACLRELNVLMPQLAHRYSPVIVIGALATHVAGTLRGMVEVGVCTPESAREVLRMLEASALAAVPQPAQDGRDERATRR